MSLNIWRGDKWSFTRRLWHFQTMKKDIDIEADAAMQEKQQGTAGENENKEGSDQPA